MDKKLFKEILAPYITVDTAIMAAFSFCAMFFSLWLGVAFLVVLIAVKVYQGLVTARRVSKKFNELKENMVVENEEITKAFIESNPAYMCVTDAAGNISWTSQGYSEDISQQSNLEGLIDQDQLAKLFANKDCQIRVAIEDRIYRVSPSSEDDFGHSKRMLFWVDITSGEIIKARFKQDRACMAVLSVDNYDELMAATPAEEQSTVAAEIDKRIRAWAQAMDAAVVRYRSANYSIVFAGQYFDQQSENGFTVLESVREIETKADFPTSISVGISTARSSYAQLLEDAKEAYEMAIGRGGDQVVIKRSDGRLEYFGGALENIENRNKGRSRIMAHTIGNLCASSDKIYVMGHARPDMDCLGAACGMAAFAKFRCEDVSIILDEAPESIDLLYNHIAQTGEIKFVKAEEVNLSPESLLIVVDVNVPAITESPEILSKADRVVVIDHHRRSSSIIENPSLSYVEPTASSASELVCEILQYSGYEYSKFVLESIMAGIYLDTKNFTTNISARTFEACAWLKRQGVKDSAVKALFKMRLDFYQKKVSIIASTQELGNGIAVAYTKEKDPAMQVLVAQAADELLQMRAIDTVFVAGMGEEKTMVSARSNGKLNVQSFMESLGGGGHINVAAAQMAMQPEEAIATIVSKLRENNLI